MKRLLSAATLATLLGTSASLAFDADHVQRLFAEMRCIACDLSNAALTSAALRGVYMQRADLSNAVLIEADLTNANLIGADLTGADLTNADLTGAFLADADLTGAILTGAKLGEVTFCNTTMPDGAVNNANCP